LFLFWDSAWVRRWGFGLCEKRVDAQRSRKASAVMSRVIWSVHCF
jgi:hypothetical protein